MIAAEDARPSGTFSQGARPAARVPTLRIQPARGPSSLGLAELWRYRELVYFFVWRDIKVRYKQTALGASWAIVQPLVTMVVFSLFFGRLAKVPSDGIPYPVFSYAALVPWMFFANGLAQGSNSLVGNANLLTKVYFPRLALPISALATSGVDFVLSFLGLAALMLYSESRLHQGCSFFPHSRCWLSSICSGSVCGSRSSTWSTEM